jgi:hypothetical protein
MVGGWFAANMGSGLVAGSAMSIIQSAAMSASTYGTAILVGGATGGMGGAYEAARAGGRRGGDDEGDGEGDGYDVKEQENEEVQDNEEVQGTEDDFEKDTPSCILSRL